ncbi:Z-DNA-binding protein 1 isoform X1 [Choloepus didactylus]|uniref:Z-DNA-binding protein 1 isoform X1 n=1 Tax=Choloepus didactylus TaxID=27675 RepID=UPI00189F9234|nr:Z-DNA-binding protein 1 isoform X1 [Choloepus didactylus]
MAKAPADPATEGDLEQKILQVLRDAGSPLKTTQLVKECQVPKKELNQVLYQMQKKSKVTLAAPATWCFGGSETRVTGPAALAEPGGALTLQKGAAAVPPTPGPQLSGRQEAIYRLLEAGGPLSALNISQALGMKTAKDVNRDLYEMRDKHLLSLDQNSKSWTIYRPGDYERKHQLTTVIYQQNPVNVIHQNGPNSQISIIHSEATQIGHGNTIKREMASGESGSTAPLRLPPTAQGDASMQGSPAGAWGVQDIHVEKSVFRRVQLGHGNEMSLHGARAEGPVLIPSGSPPASAATGQEPLFEVRMPTPGPLPEGDAAQRVHIASCFLEDTAIGNSNKMTIGAGTVGRAGVARPPDGWGRPGEWEKDTEEGPAPGSEAVLSRGDFFGDVHQAAPSNMSTLTPSFEAVTLGNGDPTPAGDGGCAAGTSDMGKQQGGWI